MDNLLLRVEGFERKTTNFEIVSILVLMDNLLLH